MSLKKGFTLIELLVVIAIIGILSSIVLASLNSARDKGADAAVKGNLNGIRAQAELFYDAHTNSYAGVCSDSNVSAALTSAKNAASASADASSKCTVSSAGDAWAAQVHLKSNTAQYYCVDSRGTATTAAAAFTLTDGGATTVNDCN